MKRVFFLFGTIIGVLVALGLAAVVGVYFWAVRDLPGFTRIADYRPALTTTVLARDGSVIGSFYRENRFLISLDQMPKMLPKAFLAAEDAEFYEHEGVNPVAIFRDGDQDFPEHLRQDISEPYRVRPQGLYWRLLR